MKSVRSRVYVSLIGLPLMLAACATGPSLDDVQSQIPPVPNDQGRIWFYRSNVPIGVAVQPAIMLNGRKVGNSVPGSVFYVDEQPGRCIVTTATETDYSVKFVLGAGEQRYVRTYIMPGILVGRVAPELVDPAEAQTDIASKSFTGATGLK